MTYVVHHPGRVTHLVLCGSNTRGPLGDSPTSEQEAEAQARLKVFELGWPNENPGYAQFFASMHIPDATTEQCRSYNDLLRRTTSPANAISLINTFIRVNVQDIVPKVTCPTLVLHSRGDPIISFDQGRKVAALIPGARFVPLESRNRIILDTEPAWQQLIGALSDFLPVDSADRELCLFLTTSQRANGISWKWLLKASTITKSPHAWTSAKRPCAIMCRRSSASSS